MPQQHVRAYNIFDTDTPFIGQQDVNNSATRSLGQRQMMDKTLARAYRHIPKGGKTEKSERVVACLASSSTLMTPYSSDPSILLPWLQPHFRLFATASALGYIDAVYVTPMLVKGSPEIVRTLIVQQKRNMGV